MILYITHLNGSMQTLLVYDSTIKSCSGGHQAIISTMHKVIVNKKKIGSGVLC